MLKEQNECIGRFFNLREKRQFRHISTFLELPSDLSKQNKFLKELLEINKKDIENAVLRHATGQGDKTEE